MHMNLRALHVGLAGPVALSDVAHLLDHPERLPCSMQGASLMVALIEELLARGFRVTAFSVDPSLAPRSDNIVVGTGLAGRFAMAYVPIRPHSMRSAGGARGRILDLYGLERQALRRAMLGAGCDLIHAHWQYEYGWAALDTGLPCVVTCHDAPWLVLRMMPNIYRLGRLLMARHVLRRASAVTAVSPYLADALRGMTRAPIDIVGNPLPRGRVPTRTPRHAPAGRPARLVMIINGWGKRKNAAAGLAAFARLRTRRAQTELHLIGPDFGEGERAQDWARRHASPEGMHFHGRMPYARTQELLNTMDLLVHPALEESFGMTICEAMSLGIPVVAGLDSGAVGWVAGIESGRLVDIRSPDAIAEAIESLLDDPAHYAACSLAGERRAAERFTASAVVSAYLDLYQKALRTATSAVGPGTMEARV